MSAFLSIINKNGKPVERGVIDRMLQARPERSVDGQDQWCEGNTVLVHQHFWVTPEEWGERQPIMDASGRLIIAADARLDNRPDLLKQLALSDVDDKQISDAALILRAFQFWGTSCVEKLLGEFAFIIWDRDQQCLFAARDVLGARGLCYYIDHDLCLLGSEVAQLLAHPNVQTELNDGRIVDFLEGNYHNQEETYYQGIKYCPPAHCMLITPEKVAKWRYWEFDPQVQIRYKNDRDYAARFLELVSEAVNSRLRTVGPVGLSLSGGLDSSLLAAVASGLLPKAGLAQDRLISFSYVFDKLSQCDEREYIQPVVDRYQLDASYIAGDDKWTLSNIEHWPLDEGYLSWDAYSWLPTAVMAAAQKKGCRVLLNGHFGDMLFLGGKSWAAGMMADLRWGQLAGTLMDHPSDIDLHRDLLLNGVRHMIPHSWRMSYSRRNPNKETSIHPGLHPDLVRRTNLQARREFDQSERRFFGPDQWHRFLDLNLNIFSQGASAAHFRYNEYGLERATPYWDQRLIEYVLAVPADQLSRPHRQRWMLRNAMGDLLPSAISERKYKTSFFALMQKGLVVKEKSTVERILDEPLILERKYIQEDWLRQRMGSENRWSRSKDTYYLWKSLSLELWLRFLDAQKAANGVGGEWYARYK